LISAIPNPFESGNLIEHAHAVNPKLEIIARAHSDAEVDYLRKFGANLIIMGEREIARGISEHILSRIDTPTAPVTDQSQNARHVDSNPMAG
jgi:CPA2 family monovalent cation:H+ antiporter-2